MSAFHAPAPPNAVAAPPDASVSFAVDAVLTVRGRDRQGDLVEPAGLDFSRFVANPVVLWAHDLSRPPIGRVRWIDVDAERVVARVEFADTPAGREIGRLYADGFLRAWSLGFIPRRWQALSPGAPLPTAPASLPRRFACDDARSPRGVWMEEPETRRDDAFDPAGIPGGLPGSASGYRVAAWGGGTASGPDSGGAGGWGTRGRPLWRKRWLDAVTGGAGDGSGGGDGASGGWHVRTAEVVEVSVVAVPANPAAVAGPVAGRRALAPRPRDFGASREAERLRALGARLLERLGASAPALP